MKAHRWIIILLPTMLAIALGCAGRTEGDRAGSIGDDADLSAESQAPPGGVQLPSDGDSSAVPGMGGEGQDADLNAAEVPPGSGITDEPAPVVVGAALPDEWPDDVPLYEGLTLRTGAPGGDNSYMIGAVGEVTADEVFEFYDSLPGWEETGPEQDNNDAREKTYARGNEELVINIMRAGGGVAVRLTYTLYEENEEGGEE